MNRIGFEYISDEARRDEFARAKALFLTQPTLLKIARTRDLTSSLDTAFSHSYIKDTSESIFAIAHETKSSRFYTQPITEVTDTDCYVWNERKLYYISTSGFYSEHNILSPSVFIKKIDGLLSREAPYTTLSASEIKALFHPEVTTTYRDGAFLGKGSYGKVKFLMDGHGQLYALKVAHESIPYEAIVSKEIGLLVSGPMKRETGCSIKYYYVFQYAGTTLSQNISHHSWNFMQKCALVPHLCLALDALHKTGYAHGDIKTDNIAIDNEKRIRYIDYGFSKPIHKKMRSTELYAITPMSCMKPAMSAQAQFEKIKGYGRIQLDYIGLQQTLFGFSYSLFSNEEYKLLGSDINHLLTEGMVKAPHFLAQLNRAFQQRVAPLDEHDREGRLDGYVNDAVLYQEKPDLENYDKVMHRLTYHFFNPSSSAWPQLLEHMALSSSVYQRGLIYFFISLVHQSILSQSDPSFVLHLISRLHLEVQIALFTYMDRNNRHVAMLATLRSVRTAHFFWTAIQSYSMKVREDILTLPDLNQHNALNIALQKNLPDAFNVLNIHQVGEKTREVIFSSASILMDCLKYSPAAFKDCMRVIRSLDLVILKKLFTAERDHFNVLMYCVVDYPEGIPELLATIHLMDLETQSKIWIQSTKEGRNALNLFCLLHMEHAASYLPPCLDAIAHLNQEAQRDIFTSPKMRSFICQNNELHQLLTLKAETVEDVFKWCELAPLFHGKLFFCATISNLCALIRLTLLSDSPKKCAPLMHPELLKTLPSAVIISWLINPDTVMSRRRTLFYFMLHYPKSVPVILHKIMCYYHDNDEEFLIQCAKIAEDICLSHSDAREETYSLEAIQLYENSVKAVVDAAPEIKRYYELLLMAYEFKEIKEIAQKSGHEAFCSALMGLYDQCCTLHQSLRRVAITEAGVQRKRIKTTCHQNIQTIRRALQECPHDPVYGIWRYTLIHRLSEIEKNYLQFQSTAVARVSAMGIFTSTSLLSKRKRLDNNVTDETPRLPY